MSKCKIIMLICKLQIPLKNLIFIWVNNFLMPISVVTDARCNIIMTTCEIHFNYVYVQIICNNMQDNWYVEINILRVNIVNSDVDIFDIKITHTQGSKLCPIDICFKKKRKKTILISMQFSCMWT